MEVNQTELEAAGLLKLMQEVGMNSSKDEYNFSSFILTSNTSLFSGFAVQAFLLYFLSTFTLWPTRADGEK